MPVDQTVTLQITCDNAACPGNDLPVDDRLGWTFVTAETYGQSPIQYVYCCAMCAGTVGDALAAREAEAEAEAEAHPALTP